jgi:hypothetical protein
MHYCDLVPSIWDTEGPQEIMEEVDEKRRDCPQTQSLNLKLIPQETANSAEAAEWFWVHRPLYSKES